MLWFSVRITGVPGHAAEGRNATNAIEKSLTVIGALRGLEFDLNAAPPAPFDLFAHPINLNVGTIRGGDWPSTVPGECVTGRTWVGEAPKGARFDRHMEFTGNDGRICVRARTFWAIIDKAAGRPIRVPPEVVAPFLAEA